MMTTEDINIIFQKLKSAGIIAPSISIKLNTGQTPTIKDLDALVDYINWSLETMSALMTKIDILVLESNIETLIQEKDNIDEELDDLREQLYFLTEKSTL